MSNPFKAGDKVKARDWLDGVYYPNGAVFTVSRIAGNMCIIEDESVLVSSRLCRQLVWHWKNLQAVINSPTTVVANTGHMPDGSGIQQHSAGGHYPYVLVYRDKKQYCDEFGRYDVGVIGPQNQTPLWFKSLNHAVRVIESMKGNEA